MFSIFTIYPWKNIQVLRMLYRTFLLIICRYTIHTFVYKSIGKDIFEGFKNRLRK